MPFICRAPGVEMAEANSFEQHDLLGTCDFLLELKPLLDIPLFLTFLHMYISTEIRISPAQASYRAHASTVTVLAHSNANIPFLAPPLQ